MSDMWDVIVVGARKRRAAGRHPRCGARRTGVADRGRRENWRDVAPCRRGKSVPRDQSARRSLGSSDTAQEHYDDAQRIAEGTIDPTLGKLATDQCGRDLRLVGRLGYEPIATCRSRAVRMSPTSPSGTTGPKPLAVAIHDVLKPVHDKLVADGKIDLRLKHPDDWASLTDASGAARWRDGGKRRQGRDSCTARTLS